MLSALGAAGITLIFFAPRFWLWPAAGATQSEFIAIQPEFHRAFYALQQLQDPWQRITDGTHRVIEWRLLFPAAAHYLRLPAFIYFLLPAVGCLLVLSVVAATTWRETRDRPTVWWATLLCATQSWFFVSTGWLAYFDSWLVLALLGASFARSRWILFGSALLAPWVDERFVLAIPLCLFVRFAMEQPSESTTASSRVADILVILVGVAPYLGTRLTAEIFHWRETSRSYWENRPLLPASVGIMALGAWEGLRFGWFAVLGALFGVVRSGKAWLPLSVTLATLVLNLCIADDLSRSASVAVPLVVAGVVLASRLRPIQFRWQLPLICVGNLLFPAAHLIASSSDPEESFHRVPILYLYAELARASDPPYYASPFAYNRRGTDAFQSGNETKARAAFDIALRFDPSFSRTHANLGIMLFQTGHRQEGMAELSLALQKSPQLYEARGQRATFRVELGDIPGALSDINEALRCAPADWPMRKDAEHFASDLAARLNRS